MTTQNRQKSNAKIKKIKQIEFTNVSLWLALLHLRNKFLKNVYTIMRVCEVLLSVQRSTAGLFLTQDSLNTKHFLLQYRNHISKVEIIEQIYIDKQNLTKLTRSVWCLCPICSVYKSHIPV